MTKSGISGLIVDDSTLGWLESLSYAVSHGTYTAADVRAPASAPSELKADIDALANWAAEIRKRRKNGGTLT